MEIVNLYNVDFLYRGVEVDYNRFYNCESYGCDSEGICRCSSIEDEHITSIDVSSIVDSIYSDIFDNSLSTKRNNAINSLFGITKELDIYTIDRILRKCLIYDKNVWEIEKDGGYYGEEITGIKLYNEYSEEVSMKLNEALSIDNVKERIEYLLNLEYGYVLPELSNKNYKIVKINKSDIIFGNGKHLESVSGKVLSHYSDKEYRGIRGVVIEKNGKYKLIDGYHRCYSTNLEEVLVLKAHL